jgi:hypothetical protein
LFFVATLRAAHSTQQLVSFRSKATPRQVLTRIEEFLPHDLRKKMRGRWRVLGGLSAYAHEPAQTTNTPAKPKQENETLEKKNQ